MERRRVLFVNHVAAMSGAEYCMLTIAEAYSHTSQVLLLDRGPFEQHLQKAGIPVKVIQAPETLLSVRTSSGLSSLKTIPAIWQLARQIANISRGYDVICANSQKAFIAASLATFMGSPPVIWHLRDIMTAKHFSQINRRIAIALANLRVSQVWVASQATANAFVAVGGRKDLVKVVHDGIGSDRFDQVQPEQVKVIRQELGIENVPVVGLFSRLSFWKGQHILLEALRSLPDVHALFVGDALFGEDDYVQTIKTLAAEADLVNRVHWLGFRNDIPQIMAACDIIVHASTEPEPCARIAVEGQLSQKPVIATAAGGMPEIVEDRITGRLIIPGDSKSLAKAISELLSDPVTTSALAKRGRESAMLKFSPKDCIAVVDRSIEEVLSTA